MKIIIFKIKKGLIKTLKKIWQNVFLLLFLFLILDLIIGVGFFLKYYSEQEKPEDYSILRVNQDLLDNFSSEFQKREENFKNTENKTYLDLFRAEF